MYARQRNALIGATALCLVAPHAGWAGGTTERVSVSSTGEQGNGLSFNAQLSSDGRYVALVTLATNLIHPDKNAFPDVLRRDRRRGVTIPVDVNSSGQQAKDSPSFAPSLSRNGRYATFHSAASNLVPGDTDGVTCPGGPCGADVFFRDLAAGTTERVSVGPGGVQEDGPSFNDGNVPNGRFVLFDSFASNLDPRTGTGHVNLFLRDRRTGALDLLTVGLHGEPADTPPARFDGTVTPDGRYVAMDDTATNLVPHDTNGQPDVVRRDRRIGRTVLVSVAVDGRQANGASTEYDISDDGNLVFFISKATNLLRGGTTAGRQHCYVRDMRAGKTWILDRAVGGGEADGDCQRVQTTPAGRYVAFTSDATDIVAHARNGHRDVFVLDRRTGRVALADLTADGRQADTGVDLPSGPGSDLAMSADGDVVEFVSDSALVPGDTNGQADVYVRTDVKELLAKADEAR